MPLNNERYERLDRMTRSILVHYITLDLSRPARQICWINRAFFDMKDRHIIIARREDESRLFLHL